MLMGRGAFTATIRYNKDNDYIEILDPDTGAWVQYEKAYVSGNYCVIMVETKSLNGEAVTCTIGETLLHGSFIGGTCVFMVEEEGSAVIACGDYSVTVEAVLNMRVKAELNSPLITATVTTDNLNGEPVYLSVAGNSYTKLFTDGQAVFEIYDTGEATLVSTNCETSFTIAAGQSNTVHINRPQAVLNLTTKDLSGETVTVIVDGVTYTGVLPCTLTLFHFGNVQITSLEKSETITVEAGGTYDFELNEFSRVDFLDSANRTMINGLTVTGNQITAFWEGKVLQMLVYNGYTAFINIPFIKEYSGKTLKIKAYTGKCPVKLRIEYKTETGTYSKEILPESNMFTFQIPEYSSSYKIFVSYYNNYGSNVTIGFTEIYIE